MKQRAGILSIQPDYILIAAVVLLAFISLMMMHSAGVHLLALRGSGNPERFFTQQLMGILAGLGAMGIASAVDYRLLKRFSVPIMLVVLLLLVLVNLKGTGRWLLQTKAGSSLQPSEFARLGVIIYAAHWLSSRRETLVSLTKGLIPFAIIVGIVTGLVILQPDLSMAALIALTGAIMFFIAGANFFQWAGSLLMGGAAAVTVIQMGIFHYAQKRIMLWEQVQRFLRGEPISPEYMSEQPFYALGSFIRGGLLGKGLGQASMAPIMGETLPSDGMMCLVAEELGFVGCLVVVALLGLVIYRGFAIASQTEDLFGKLIASGFCWSLALQALIHLASLVGLMPMTGMVFPFLSLGGSAMVTSMTGVGLLMNILARGKEEKKSEVYLHRWGHRRPRLSRPRRSRKAKR